MPQQTNLNVAPYFDDFDAASDYHKVLFKPGYPVQARELNNLQSILQNQIEKFGQHFFKEGAKVIPGNISYSRNYTGIQLNNNYKGIPVAAYVDQLIGAKLTGLTSGITAVVGDILVAEDSERNNLTLYCNYISSSSVNNSNEIFLDGEDLACNVDITSGLLGNAVITAGAPFATTIDLNAAITGSAFHVDEGVYFVRGQFIPVNKETLILDQYGTLPSYRIGFYIDEQIITADQDESLTDNSQGYNNYSAPGADRLKISLFLFKKDLTDLDDNNFVELAKVINGVLQITATKTLGGGAWDINDTLARRTFDESGDYYVRPFNIQLLESLNDNIGNHGVFQSDQFTYGGSVPSDALALYKISPGKAYVKGYEIETVGSTWIDVDKPRTTKTLEDQAVIYNTGLTLNLNSVWRTPTIGIGNTYYLSLRDQRVGINSEAAPGNEIGLARVYDFRLDAGAYDTLNDKVNVWGISLYDVQRYTNIALNESHTLTVPCFIEGQDSGATAFLRSAVSSSTALTVYDVSGEFIKNEELSFNGISNGRIAIAVTENAISDVKSLYGTNNGTSGINTFTANVVQSIKNNVGIVTITPPSGSPSISTVRSNNLYDPSIDLNSSLAGPNFVKLGDLVQYTDTTSGSADPIMARVTYVGTGTDVPSSRIEIVGVATVTGIAEGALPSTQISPTDFKVLTTNLSDSDDDSLYTVLSKPNVSDVDLTSASISIRKTFNVDIASNEITSVTKPTAGTNEVFLPFDEDRYSLIRSDGTTESLAADRFFFNPTATEITLRGLGSADTGATFIGTLKKVKPTAKKKIKNRVNSLIVNKSRNAASGIGSTTADDGLDYGDGNYPYGTRVQDEVISLNTPDIVTIHGIYESADTGNASAPKVTLTSIISTSNTTEEIVIGEQLIGQTTKSVAICAEKLSASQISYIGKNDFQFVEGETVVFQESGVTAIVSVLNSPSFEINSSYTFNSGQKETFYNYGTIKRKDDVQSPSKQLKIYFENAYYDSTDEGDITTVNSYDTFNYTNEIQSIDSVRNTDTIDIRPRTTTLTSVAEGDRSPLEFLGRTFNASGNSASNILASNENIIIDFSYYLGRKDRIFLTKEGNFQLVYGNPSDNPENPNPVDDSIEVAGITLPPYLYNPKQAVIKFLDYKRFRMSDIKRLEDRISNLEYYTALSLLEVNTANLFVADNNGLNRYKSGFFVDNFTTFKTQDNTITKNSIDRQNHICRPSHYTTSVDLINGPVVNVDSTVDKSFSPVQGTNVRKQNGVITLDYAEQGWVSQTFATRVENVTPFLINFWKGTIELTPASDTWMDVHRLEARIIEVEGNFAETLREHVEHMSVDAQTGFAPIVWNAWETDWTGSTTRSGGTRDRSVSQWIGGSLRTQVFREVMEERIDTGVRTREGTQLSVEEQFDRVSIGDREVSRSLIDTMRSRNIEFHAKRIKPLTRMYGFFDGIDVTRYCVPKLLEISMLNGTFEVGETVIGTMPMVGDAPPHPTRCASIRFRVAQTNHKEGPYNIPTKIYQGIPYNTANQLDSFLPAVYTTNSTILNVDTLSLAEPGDDQDFWGWVEADMDLLGQSSGATAKITDVRLISDRSADLIGNFFIPDPNCINHPDFETGEKTFTLVNSADNDQQEASTIAEEEFTSTGTLQTVQQNIISIRNARIENRDRFESQNAERTTGMVAVQSDLISTSWWTPPPPPPPRGGDPLAQSFHVAENTGVFVTKCDIFFRDKDTMDIPVTLQIRTMADGLPTEKVLPFSEVILSPDEVMLSTDGTFATTFQFKAPVYLEGGSSYCICLASDCANYNVFVSRVGEIDLLTQSFVSEQPFMGSLFKSQNSYTWEPSQWEDLKFTLYRADFLSNGSVEFYNPELTEANQQIPILTPNALTPIARQIRVGLGTTVSDSGYVMGNTFSQSGTNATANIVGTAGTATGSLTISNAGIGYTPVDGSYSFSDVTLNTLTGKGRGATGNITVTNGVAIAATISDGGSGYQVGDVLSISNIGIASLGRNMRLSISGIGVTSEIILDNVQGEFTTGTANTFFYVNNSGITTELNYTAGGNVNASSISVDTDGTHIKVKHDNHGMYAAGNIVKISNVLSDVRPTKLQTSLSKGFTSGGMNVDDPSSFATFENVGIGTTNVGFALIEDEILQYTNITGNTLNILSVEGGDLKRSYPVGTLVYKYELDGVNLKRINGIHTLSDATVSDPITLDSYHIKLDMAQKFNINNADRSTDGGFPKLYLNESKSAGGFNARATQNIPFEVLTPIIQNVTVNGTSLSGEIRTTTNSSISGSEIPFADAGYQAFNLDSPNYFETPRMIASKINADAQLTNVEGNKSLNMRLFLGTVDGRVSPVIDAQRVSAIFTSNRVNEVISNYATDKRVNSILTDPTAFQYISKKVVLENPATSIKIFVAAHISPFSDIRAFYAIGDGSGFRPIFTPFPGYTNLNGRGQIISKEDSNGLPDAFVPKSNREAFNPLDVEFKDYNFTVDNLPSFKTYQIKLIFTSTDQVYVPQMKDLRVIALA